VEKKKERGESGDTKPYPALSSPQFKMGSLGGPTRARPLPAISLRETFLE
jgi:hypothetical protein